MSTRIITPDDYLKAEREIERLRRDNTRLSAEIQSMRSSYDPKRDAKTEAKADNTSDNEPKSDKPGS